MVILTQKIGQNEAVLTEYISACTPAITDSDCRPAVLIFPGGGYEFVSDSENEPIALSYAAKGFQAFTLKYSVKEKGVFPIAQQEAFEAIAFIRQHAKKLYVNPDKITVVGFSAGGHLAASVSVHWDNPQVNVLKDRRTAKPNSAVLIYPCITTGAYAYPGITQVHGNGTLYPQLLSVENYVSHSTPPTFICHAAQDDCVPVMNALLYACALSKSQIPFELRVYKEGVHGMSLATKAVSSPLLDTLDGATKQKLKSMCAKFSEWFDKSVEFLSTL